MELFQINRISILKCWQTLLRFTVIGSRIITSMPLYPNERANIDWIEIVELVCCVLRVSCEMCIIVLLTGFWQIWLRISLLYRTGNVFFLIKYIPNSGKTSSSKVLLNLEMCISYLRTSLRSISGRACTFTILFWLVFLSCAFWQQLAQFGQRERRKKKKIEKSALFSSGCALLPAILDSI